MSQRKFIKCSECGKKPKTPGLCESCLHNRAVIAQLRLDVDVLWSALGAIKSVLAKLENL